MTGLDFIAAGVTAKVGPDGLYVAVGPAGRSDLLEALRFEVLTRIDMVGDADGVPRLHRDLYRCDTCGDRIGHERKPAEPCPLCPDRCRTVATGLCLICLLARSKALRARREREK